MSIRFEYRTLDGRVSKSAQGSIALRNAPLPIYDRSGPLPPSVSRLQQRCRRLLHPLPSFRFQAWPPERRPTRGTSHARRCGRLPAIRSFGIDCTPGSRGARQCPEARSLKDALADLRGRVETFPARIDAITAAVGGGLKSAAVEWLGSLRRDALLTEIEGNQKGGGPDKARPTSSAARTDIAPPAPGDDLEPATFPALEKAIAKTQDAIKAAVSGPAIGIVSSPEREAAIKGMVDAIKLVRSIICDGASTGFQPLVGDWAERLFASQADTHAALASARAAGIGEARDG